MTYLEIVIHARNVKRETFLNRQANIPVFNTFMINMDICEISR